MAIGPEAGTEQRIRMGEETILVVQSGNGSVSVSGETFAVSRKDVFNERASAVYAPPGEAITVSASSDLEAILVSTPAETGGAPAAVSGDDVRVNARGRDIYAREVHASS